MILNYSVHISANGEVSPIPDWLGGEAEARLVIVRQKKDVSEETNRKATKRSKLEEQTPEERQAAYDDFLKFAGCLADMPGKELVSKKQIRSSRLEERYGDQTEEQRKEAGRKFFETWNGLLEGMPDMTAKEIRAERLEKRYGQ